MENKAHALAAGTFVLVSGSACWWSLASWLNTDTRERYTCTSCPRA